MGAGGRCGSIGSGLERSGNPQPHRGKWSVPLGAMEAEGHSEADPGPAGMGRGPRGVEVWWLEACVGGQGAELHLILCSHDLETQHFKQGAGIFIFP